MRVNKKLLQQHMTQSTGKIITLKEKSLRKSNIQKSLCKRDGNDLEIVVSYLKTPKCKAWICRLCYEENIQ